MEYGWALLLILASMDRQARPLALLTAAAWGMSYAAFWAGLYRAPVAVDVVLGLMCAALVHRLPTVRMRVFSACIAVAPLIHAWHWLLWDAGSANDIVRDAYYTLLALLFSVKALSLSWPGVLNLVGIVADSLGRAGRFALDRLAPVPRQRPRPSR